MPVPRFLCVDDNASESNALIAQLNASRVIKIVGEEPKQQEQEVEEVLSSGCDGVILDLRLDNKVTANGFRAQYTSNALAQGIRDRITLKNLKDIPIVLWSSQTRLREFYDLEQTGHDLYDDVIVKSEIQRDFNGIARRLKTLAQGYLVVNELHGLGRPGLFRMLGMDEEATLRFDPRIGAQYENGEARRFPPHRFSRYIMTEIIGQPYPLVSEGLLAARLGVDASSRGWGTLVTKLAPAKYKGVFGDGWPRWWWDNVARFLLENAGLSTRTLRDLEAEDRVDVLHRELSVKHLQAAAPIASGYSTAFWTICDGLDKPLDPEDGFVSSWSSREAWHDRRYISLKAAVERKRHKEGLRVQPLDQARFEQIMKGSKNVRNK